jgi:hypothetical protein
MRDGESKAVAKEEKLRQLLLMLDIPQLFSASTCFVGNLRWLIPRNQQQQSVIMREMWEALWIKRMEVWRRMNENLMKKNG